MSAATEELATEVCFVSQPDAKEVHSETGSVPYYPTLIIRKKLAYHRRRSFSGLYGIANKCHRAKMRPL